MFISTFTVTLVVTRLNKAHLFFFVEFVAATSCTSGSAAAAALFIYGDNLNRKVDQV